MRGEREDTEYQYPDEIVDCTKDSTDIEMITRKYFELLYGNDLNNLSKTEKFLEVHNLSTCTKWVQKEKEIICLMRTPETFQKKKIMDQYVS